MHPLGLAVLAMLVSAGLFVALAGSTGLVFFLAAALLQWFSVQSINYIQHYGLGDRLSNTGLNFSPVAWDDTCFIEACLTFNILFHEQHHREPTRPYWQLELRPSHAVLPASYTVMFVFALFPPLFRAVMGRRLARLREDLRESGGLPPASVPCRTLPWRHEADTRRAG